jgi:anti-anti-sigma factor
LTSPADLLFGKLVLLNRYAAREQVDACLVEQEALAREGKTVPLGELMRQKNFLTSDQIDSLLMEQTYLEVRKEDLRIGELAIKNGLASETQVSECLTLQDKRFREKKDLFRIGEIMQERGYVTEQQVTALLKAQERLKAAAAAQRQREKEAIANMPRTYQGQPSLRDSYTAPPASGAVRKPKSEPALPTASPAMPPQRRPSDPTLRAVSMGAPPAAPLEKTPSEPRLVPHGGTPQTRSRDPWVNVTSGSEPVLNAEGVRAQARVVELEGTGTAKHKQVVVVSVEGILDAHTFPYFERYMNELADAGHQYFVVNCAKLDYISSPGIGVLIGMAKRAKDTNGDLRVAELSAKIKQVFNLIGGGGLIRVFEIERGAIMSFKYI